MGHSIQPDVEHTETTTVDTRPSYGRMHGVGDSATWKKYYRETTEEKKERRRLTEGSIHKKVEIAVEKKSSQKSQQR